MVQISHKSSMVEKSNTVIIIVTYNPSIILFKYLLEQCRLLAFRIIVVDNGSGVKPVCEGSDFLISDRNKGIAWALNIGIHYALRYNPKYIITFDQDSIPATNILDAYNVVLKDLGSSVGLISGGFALQSSEVYFPIRYKDSINLITSGTLHNVEIFKKVGLYEEKLFIDSVDFDFVMRVHKAGFSTIRIQNDIIKHKIGDPLSKRILGIMVTSSNHNEVRRYYQARNLVYLTRRYGLCYPRQILNFNYYYYFKILPKMCLVERPLLNKLKATLKGLRDGLFFR